MCPCCPRAPVICLVKKTSLQGFDSPGPGPPGPDCQDRVGPGPGFNVTLEVEGFGASSPGGPGRLGTRWHERREAYPANELKCWVTQIKSASGAPVGMSRGH
eukprot:749853-Hanusia_phi.AAC.2